MEFNVSELAALLQVILIDLALAGDNAIAVGLAASALPRAQQRNAILWGILLALVLRIAFSLLAILGFQNVPYLMIAGGLLLFWVAWRMWADLQAHQPVTVLDPVAGEHGAEAIASGGKRPTTFASALMTIIIADVSMSLDNVLAVAAVALEHPFIMAFGLVLSVILMGVAASIIARVIQRFRWIAIVGIVIIIIAGGRMIWEGGHRDFPQYVPEMPMLLGAH
ncbi:YjbE family putative metal transport protein [Terricaulis sp.]|uniref:YjbE family putative metal transport protein n=1 Tax=Terricaulis sp. TaxID=2768686 RepID=UPI003784FF7F